MPLASDDDLLVAPTSATLGYGSVPDYPGSLTLSRSLIINSLLGDIPLLTAGLVAFTVFTFFLILRRTNKFIWMLSISVFSNALASLFDVSQLLMRGTQAVQSGVDVQEATPLIIIREVSTSFAIGILSLLFWFYISLPPRGELEVPYGGRVYSRPLGVVDYPEAYHSGCWDRWGAIGVLLKWTLLASVLASPVLQIVWRITAFTATFGTIYNAAATLQITMSSLFVMKLLGNAWLSPLTPKWYCVRDYLPVLVSLLIGIGVSVGDAVQFKFSATPLGHFLLAVELYILLLYTLTATFHTAPKAPRTSQTPIDRIDLNHSYSTFRVPIPNVQTPSLQEAAYAADADTGNSRPPLSRLSTWMQRRLSTIDIQNPTTTVRGDDPARYSPFDEKKDRKYLDAYVPNTYSYASNTDRSSTTAGEGHRQGNAGSQVKSQTAGVAEPLRVEPKKLQIPSSSMIGDSPTIPATIFGNSSDASPIYGLNGIIRKGSTISSSSRSSDLDSLYRQQAELDKSVAGLQLYLEGKGSTSQKPDPLSPSPSEFTLSNFPEPPLAASRSRSRASLSSVKAGGGDPVKEKKSIVVDDVGFTLVPPRMPAAVQEEASRGHERQLSFPHSDLDSTDSVLLSPGNPRTRVSNGTQYDVTSFIGGLSTPDKLVQPGEQDLQTVLEKVDSGVESTRLKGNDNTLGQLAKSSSKTEPRIIAIGRPPPGNTSVVQAPTTTPPYNSKVGLPWRPKISAPLIRVSQDTSTAFEHPRQPPSAP